ncbi:helix-turn-helix domain-containing protein [Herbiconiux sp. KACC 21604]|uniref:helix-turn-helix domain-containing protein n=1 Tax=unclassified Herbiconiux TaxID=2618217 RepID=UPI00149273F5|nr:helix-turn-helix domain-containing protein [Herbiconiux sp. SALV-R1]QJU54381.1 helix-turn-helix domain-containing protein [Herbiconiux sp. SALV-R1]WPO85452.1 helix-turn-helix domain-containing protein [Herbiconiux sp. KACC 21604]
MSATRWLTEQQCSEQTGIPVGTLRDWRMKGLNLPFSRIGRLVRYAESEVDTYMRSQQVDVKQSA